MRYRNLPRAIDWLCTAFGFTRHRIVTGRNDTVLFAQLTLGNAMIMVGPVRASAFDKILKQPDEVGGAETQVCYFFVADARAHCTKARAAGAEIIFSTEDKRHGGHSYSCRDPEGHVWNFGTYDPWRQQVITEDPPLHCPPRRGRALRPAAVAVVLSAAALAAVTILGARFLQGPWGWQAAEAIPAAAAGTAGPTPQQAAADAGERAESEARARAAEAQGRGEAAEQAARLADKEADEARRSARLAEQAATRLRERLAEAETSRAAAEQAAREAQDQLAKALANKGVFERAARQARRQLAIERNARRATGLLFPVDQSPSVAAAPPWQ